MSSAKYQRLLLKVSGEMLAGERGYGIQPSILETLAEEIASVVALEVQVAVVIGGGNVKLLKPFRRHFGPRSIVAGHNDRAFVGGVKLWSRRRA